jgi:hypothetical protein
MSTIAKTNGKRDRDTLLASALAHGASYAEAGRVAGLSKATVSRRMAEPAFRGRVTKEREETLERVRGMLVEGSLDAARTLVELATGASTESVRLAASLRMLEITLRRRAGFDTYSTEEVSALVSAIVERSMARMPEEEHESYLHEVRAIGAR